MREIAEIIELLRIKKILKSVPQIAKLLNMSYNALDNHVQRGTIPFKQLVAFCEFEGISFDWLVLGQKNYKEEADRLHSELNNAKKRITELEEMQEVFRRVVKKIPPGDY